MCIRKLTIDNNKADRGQEVHCYCGLKKKTAEARANDWYCDGHWYCNYLKRKPDDTFP